MKNIFFVAVVCLIPLGSAYAALRACGHTGLGNCTSGYASSLSSWEVTCGGARYYGVAACANFGSGGGNYSVKTITQGAFSENAYCWCRLISDTGVASNWIYASDYSSTGYIKDATSCYNNCSTACVYHITQRSDKDYWQDYYNYNGWN